MKLPETNTFELETKLLIADTKTINTLFATENGADAVALYFFYYTTAKRQDTNQVRATEAFVKTGLRWGAKRFRDAYAVLNSFGLVEIIKSSTKWYVRLSYIKKSNSAQKNLVEIEPNSTQKQLVAFGPQMLKTEDSKLNAFTSTNVEGRRSVKKPTCPLLNGSPFKTDYPNGHKECIDWKLSLEEYRGSRVVNDAKFFNLNHKLLTKGHSFKCQDKAIDQIAKKFGKESVEISLIVGFIERGACAKVHNR